MEMNTRLQVEHPVTEMLTGLDLVEWQLRVARGEPLPLTQDEVRWQGHAIEVRLCAEDEQFTPHTGEVLRFDPPESGAGLRFDHALATGLEVTPFYDAMLGKLIAHAPTRAEAIDQLARALDDTAVLGLPTNRSLLAACLRHPVFRAGEATIPFLQTQGDGLREALALRAPALKVAAALAVCFSASPPAQALPCPYPRTLSLAFGDGERETWSVQERGAGQVRVRSADGAEHLAVVQPTSDSALRIRIDGLEHRVLAVRVRGQRCQVQIAGHEVWLTDLSHAAVASADGSTSRELRAPFNGKLLAVNVAPGQRVVRGETLVVIESMKLEHALTAPRDAVVAEVLLAAGVQVAPGQLLLRFES
jgi:3-methylcrotonyl-CoA carboxylase alpha subunit/geranyl-CoA carboxylase alpha subunit